MKSSRPFCFLVAILLMSCRNSTNDRFFSEVVTVPGQHQNAIYQFDKPVAVEAFFRMNDFTKEGAKESIENNRQEYYNVIDAHGFYEAVVHKELDRLQIPIIPINEAAGFIRFQNKAFHYLVDLKAYKDQSGVFLFNPGRSPVFFSSTGKTDQVRDSIRAFFAERSN